VPLLLLLYQGYTWSTHDFAFTVGATARWLKCPHPCLTF